MSSVIILASIGGAFYLANRGIRNKSATKSVYAQNDAGPINPQAWRNSTRLNGEHTAQVQIEGGSINHGRANIIDVLDRKVFHGAISYLKMRLAEATTKTQQVAAYALRGNDSQVMTGYAQRATVIINTADNN